MSKTQQYQYRTKDGQQFQTKEQKEYYLEQQLEKKEQARDEQYREQLDHLPAWDFMDSDQYEC